MNYLNHYFKDYAVLNRSDIETIKNSLGLTCKNKEMLDLEMDGIEYLVFSREYRLDRFGNQTYPAPYLTFEKNGFIRMVMGSWLNICYAAWQTHLPHIGNKLFAPDVLNDSIQDICSKHGMDVLSLQTDHYNWLLTDKVIQTSFFTRVKQIFCGVPNKVNNLTPSQQAFSAFPILPFILSDIMEKEITSTGLYQRKTNYLSENEERCKNIINAVIEQEPLKDLLAKQLSLPSWVIQRLHGFTPPSSLLDLSNKLARSKEKKFPVKDVPTLVQIIQISGYLKPDHWPKNDKGWKDILTIQGFTANLSSSIPLEDKNIQDFVHANGNVIGTLNDRFLNIQYADLLKDVQDNFIAAVLNKIDNEHLQDTAKSDDYVKKISMCFLFKDISIKNMMENSVLWHQKQRLIVSELSSLFPTKQKVFAWPKITEDFASSNGYGITCLNTNVLLRNEGEQMQHCVGGYTTACLSGSSHILSIRSNNGMDKSTAEILYRKEFKTITVKQHYSFRNSQVSEACKFALNEWIENADIQDDKLVYSDNIKDLNELNYYSRQKFRFYDTSSTEALEYAWTKYKIFFPKSIQKIDFQTLLKCFTAFCKT